MRVLCSHSTTCIGGEIGTCVGALVQIVWQVFLAQLEVLKYKYLMLIILGISFEVDYLLVPEGCASKAR